MPASSPASGAPRWSPALPENLQPAAAHAGAGVRAGIAFDRQTLPPRMARPACAPTSPMTRTAALRHARRHAVEAAAAALEDDVCEIAAGDAENVADT